MRTRAHALFVAILLSLALSGTAASQDTTARVRPSMVRTFTLRHLSADDAVALVRPYVGREFVAAGPAGLSLITVRADAPTLATIERLITDFDRPPSTFTFRFQLIAATEGSPRPDPALSAVEPLLRDLFRFGGYRLLSQAAINASAGTSTEQTIGDGTGRMSLRVSLHGAETQGTAGSVRVEIRLSRRVQEGGPVVVETLLSTGLTIPLGQTVVLGSAVTDQDPRIPDARALILTVQPELAKSGR